VRTEWAENVAGIVYAKGRGEIQGQCVDITMTLKNQDMMVCGAHIWLSVGNCTETCDRGNGTSGSITVGTFLFD
jgi:hypothetical protein